jgi:hypothetical protein
MSRNQQHNDIPESPQNQRPPTKEQEIAQRAYFVYLARGSGDGHALDDWLQAEQELREQNARQQNPAAA